MQLPADISRLVATLGSKSNLRKVNRKAILDVDVPATCQVIIEPEAPMALRLQSNLLYGVSRVFSQQCGYILSDAENFQANMRAFIKAVKTSELDPNAGKARRDQLVLEDDPAFLPDFALPGLDINLSALDISADESSRRSSILSPHSQRSSLSSYADADESMLGLVIPTSESGGAGDLGGFMLPGGSVSSAQRSAQLGRLLDDEDEGFNVNPGFTIDGEGNLIEERTPGPGPGGAPSGAVRLGNDSAASGRVRQELWDGLQAGQYERDAMDLDVDIPRFEEDDILLPNVEPFPEMAPPGAVLRKSSTEVPREHESSDSAEAPLQRKRRKPKLLPVDQRMELHNADLAQWKIDYAGNMAEAIEAKRHHKAPALAKKNAAFWVIGAGIGGVGAGLGSSKLKSPLDMFAGDAMMEALTGVKPPTTGRKRSREEEDSHESDSEARGVRMKVDESDQVGRGQELMLNDDGTIMSEGVELGRHAPASLPEDPTMPWNASSALGSRQGSTMRGRGLASSIGGFPTSAGGPSSMPGIGGIGPSSLDRRGSRITSASPLIGRGLPRYSSIELPLGNDDDDLQGGRVVSDDQALDDFQLYGPGAAIDTQTAADSQWVRSTLNQEANNFLTFVQAKIAEVPAPEDEEEDELSGNAQPGVSVTFEELLPPEQNTKVVASQALYHILALATKNLLHVQQYLPDKRINLSVPPGV